MRKLTTAITVNYIVAISLATTPGCDDRQPSPASQMPPTTDTQPVRQENLQEAIIPDDVQYSILESNTLPGIKRNLDVRLNKKVSEGTLHAIALRLKSQDSRDYDRTFIAYYLPAMTPGAGAWATTHFDPDVEVRILGLTAEEEEKLVTEATRPSREVIGRWLDESPYVGSRITIFREQGKLFIERSFKDGSSLKEEVAEKTSSGGRRFEKAEGSSTGDHWLIGSDGNLQIRDNDGLISTAKKIR